jgi:hypothetical protein
MAEVVSLAPQPWPQRRFCRSGSGSPASGPSNGTPSIATVTPPPTDDELSSARTRVARRSIFPPTPFPPSWRWQSDGPADECAGGAGTTVGRGRSGCL